MQAVGVTVVTGKSALWAPDRRAATVGLLMLVTLSAFESMGVTTALPTLVHDLHGEELYSWPFTMFLAAQVVGNVVGGRLCDRRGPTPALTVGPAMFAVGLLVAGVAQGMTQLLVGRALQGFGGGVEMVGLYVLVAQVYPERHRPVVFGAFATAWVVPSLVGPTVAGLLAQYLSWRWIFLGLAPLVLVGWGLVLIVLRRLPAFEPPATEPHRRGLTAAAVAAAIGLAVLSWAGDHPSGAGLGAALLGAAALVPGVLVLLPRGTLRARIGLPSAVLARGLMSAAFMGSEAFLPLVLQQVHGFSPAWAGVPLTTAALGWAVGSWLQPRYPELSPARFVRWGFLAIAAGVGLVTLVAPAWGPPWVAAPAWILAGFGMGLGTSSVSVLVLNLSPAAERGFNSAALQMSDLFGQSILIGLGGVLVAALGPTAGWTPLNALLVALALLGGLVVSRRSDQRS
ncbi:MFS transporter [Kutzneria buriramensis]|uniref:MFS transporter n=1 Tax=Kutzneria buriramensis TaxID=1045776 RepID=UPI000E21F8FF|nr:MFS transporter [Kutzneria buriramensis]